MGRLESVLIGQKFGSRRHMLIETANGIASHVGTRAYCSQ